MKLYKLTTRDGRTRVGKPNETQWGPGVTHRARGTSERLCSNGLIHAYEDPLVAALMNPQHANIRDPALWECRAPKPLTRDGDLKCGVRQLTTLRRVPLPELTPEHRVEVAIRCALLVCRDPAFEAWTRDWISGKDRTETTARAAARAAAETAVQAAAVTAARATARAAEAATWAAEAAARAAAEAAARAAEAATRTPLPLIAILHDVCDPKETK